MKTFEQCCDGVAKKDDCENWNDFYKYCADNSLFETLEDTIREAAILYAHECVKTKMK